MSAYSAKMLQRFIFKIIFEEQGQGREVPEQGIGAEIISSQNSREDFPYTMYIYITSWTRTLWHHTYYV